MSVREAIRWSYDLLDAPEQALLCRLAVFEGSFTSDRVQAVCSPESSRFEVLRTLEKLVEKSMVQVKSSPDGQERRLYLLETVQQFGRDKLEARGEVDEFEGRHGRHFLATAEELWPQLREAPNTSLLGRLAEIHDDVRVALQRWMEKADVASATRLAAAFWRFWEIRGQFAEGRRILSKLLSEPMPADAPHAYSRLLSGAGLLAFRQGEHLRAKPLFRKALDLERKRSEPDWARLGECLNHVGLAAGREGDGSDSVEHHQQYLEIAERHLGKRDVAIAHNNLGAEAFAVGNLAEAEKRLTLSAKLFTEIGNESDVAYPLTLLGAVLVVRRDHQAAVVYLTQALEWRDRVQSFRGTAEALNWLGRAALCVRDLAESRRCLAQAMEHARQVESSREIADILDSMALVASEGADPELALILAARSDALRQETSLPRRPVLQPEHDEAVSRSRAHLGSAASEAARIEGATRSLEDVLRKYVTSGRIELEG